MPVSRSTFDFLHLLSICISLPKSLSLWFPCMACSVVHGYGLYNDPPFTPRRAVQQNGQVEFRERSTKEWAPIGPPLVPSAFWTAERSCTTDGFDGRSRFPCNKKVVKEKHRHFNQLLYFSSSSSLMISLRLSFRLLHTLG